MGEHINAWYDGYKVAQRDILKEIDAWLEHPCTEAHMYSELFDCYQSWPVNTKRRGCPKCRAILHETLVEGRMPDARK